MEAIAGDARAVIEGALPDGVYLIGEDLMVEVVEWPETRPLPDGWQEEVRDALDPGSGPATRPPDVRAAGLTVGARRPLATYWTGDA